MEDTRQISIPLLIPTAIIFVLTIFGIYGNSCIIVATFMTKSLRNVCNWLICFASIGDLIHQLGHFFLFYFVITGQNTTKHSYCFYLQLIPAFFLNFGIFYTFAVGVDRLLVVMFPTRHPFIGKRDYLIITLIVASFYSLSLLLVGYQTMIENPNREVVCVVIGEIYQARAKVIWVIVQVVLVFLIISVYGIFWVYVKFTKDEKSSVHKAMKSLTIVMIILVFGWVVSSTVRVISLILVVDDRTLLYVLLYSGILTNFGCSANYYVYFYMSTDYRAVFKLQLAKVGLYKNRTNTNSIAPLSSQINSNRFNEPNRQTVHSAY